MKPPHLDRRRLNRSHVPPARARSASTRLHRDSSSMMGTPTWWRTWARQQAPAAPAADYPQTLHVVLTGNAHLDLELAKAVDAVFPDSPAELHPLGRSD